VSLEWMRIRARENEARARALARSSLGAGSSDLVLIEITAGVDLGEGSRNGDPVVLNPEPAANRAVDAEVSQGPPPTPWTTTG
jgi:hypothetical protein